ncbi:MAG: acyltransferase [Chitinophagaceae bacterium]
MSVTKTKKYSYIDSIRGYAVLMVLATHIFAFGGGSSNPDIALSKFWVQCRMGVMLFYMISALTLFLSYDQKLKVETHPVKNFFIRRFFRIVPLFYIICLFRIISPYIGIVTPKFDLMNIIGTVTFTNGFMPKYIHGIVVGGWSIAVESIFYLTVPILFKFITDIKRSVIFFILAVGLAVVLHSLAFRFLGTHFSNDVLMNWTLVWLPLQLPVFALGIFLYFLFFKSGFSAADHTKFNKPLSYFMVFTGLYFFIVASYGTRLFINENIGLSFALMLFIIAMAIHPGSYLNNKMMQFFGKISYSFYLLHPIVISFVGEPALNKVSQHMNPTLGFFVCYGLMLALTAAASYLSYRFIEQPFQKMGGKIIERSENRNIKDNIDVSNTVDNTAI